MNLQLDSKRLGVVSPRKLDDEAKAINDGIRRYLYEGVDEWIAAHENIDA